MTAGEERLYGWMLRQQRTTSVETVPQRLALTPETAKAALERLHALGLVARTGPTLAEYAPVTPRVAIEACIVRRHQELEAVRRRAGQLCAHFDSARGVAEAAIALERVDLNERSTANLPTPEERAILELMAAGLKDETAAQRLHMSTRTFARRVAALMERLGAATRFQAGYLTARRAWLEDPRGHADR